MLEREERCITKGKKKGKGIEICRQVWRDGEVKKCEEITVKRVRELVEWTVSLKHREKWRNCILFLFLFWAIDIKNLKINLLISLKFNLFKNYLI